MTARVVMLQGTTSSAGKSFLVAGLCRLFTQEGLNVAPFKSQNMSNNAAVTSEGHEIGRAQAVQALAARQRPHVDMNPVLLKPEADHRSQVIVMGRPYATLNAAAYQEAKLRVWDEVTGALERLRATHDLVIIEGAGSPAEINLKARDISNMRVALHAEAPVLIAGDIDRGGIFAHFYGTVALLDPPERALVKGFIINRMRGDPALLEPALTDIERLTGVPVAGVVPWIREHGIPEEDAVAIEDRRDGAGPLAGVDIAVIQLPRIANFDDFDPLEREPSVRLRYVTDPARLGTPDLVILPGTKATIADLDWFRTTGLADAVAGARAEGTAIAGICGGFQMLGRRIRDEAGFESRALAEAEGLGWLAVNTTFGEAKVTRQSRIRFAGGPGIVEGLDGVEGEGYEIHAGITDPGPARVVAELPGGEPLGVVDESGTIFGCYLHGLFHNDAIRQGMLGNVARLRGKAYTPAPAASLDAAFDRVADVLRSSLDLPLIYGLVGLSSEVREPRSERPGGRGGGR